MDTILKWIALPLGYVMQLCSHLFSNYGLAIILFTFISKVILMPLSYMLQKNSIKMVKMQPEINMIKVNYFGDKEHIDEEQSRLFKREKYHPLLSTIPLIIQVILLMGVIEVIYKPFTYIFSCTQGSIQGILNLTSQLTGMELSNSSIQLAAVEAIQNPDFLPMFRDLGPAYTEIIDRALHFDMSFLGLSIGWIPWTHGSFALLVPVVAGFSAWLMCFIQNKDNVLQAEQSKWNKYGMMILSVGISLYLGLYVPAGVALYWIFSNLFAILTLWLLNALVPPKKYVDYEKLEASRAALAQLNGLSRKKSIFSRDPNAKREKADYKRFFQVANKHLVVYAEGSGYYKYFRGIIDYILRKSNIIIHYITPDPKDIIFEEAKKNPQIHPYYIGEKRFITLMLKLDTDMILMTTPDLETYQIKRSYVRKDIEYVYVDHGIGSTNTTLRTHCLDHFDTVCTTGPWQDQELRAIEKLYGTPEKKLIPGGYCLLDEMCESYQNSPKVHNAKTTILIAPSWQKDNLLDYCLDDLLSNLLNRGYRVILRPHPQYVRIYQAKLQKIMEDYKDRIGPDFEIQTDFSSNSTVYNADIVITDWSAIGCEFSFTTLKPTIYINTPMKIMNPDWQKIDVPPIDITLRNQIGRAFDVKDFGKMPEIIDDMVAHPEVYKKDILKAREDCVYNLGTASQHIGDYILHSIIEHQKKAKEEQ